jgi:hypothetical protein
MSVVQLAQILIDAGFNVVVLRKRTARSRQLCFFSRVAFTNVLTISWRVRK